MSQKDLLEKARTWLESEKGCQAIIVHRLPFPINIRDILSVKSSMEPDVIGIKDVNTVYIVEASPKISDRNIFGIIGKCMIWKTLVKYVYVAFPEEASLKGKLFEALEIGLLSISKEAKEVYEPPEVSYKVNILDQRKQQHLYNQVQSMIEK